jgi:hypothetical protein
MALRSRAACRVPKVNPTKVLHDLPDWRFCFSACNFKEPVIVERSAMGETRVREIQHIQHLALKLSQERDPPKIKELIDEIRHAASAYLGSTSNQDSESAGGSR